MSTKRKVVDKRLTLFRTCGVCGKSFVTTADTPWVRQVPRDGKRQATTYYCSTTCYQASYKYKGWYDGKTEERRREREKKRPDRSAYMAKWRAEHRDHIREYNRERAIPKEKEPPESETGGGGMSVMQEYPVTPQAPVRRTARTEAATACCIVPTGTPSIGRRGIRCMPCEPQPPRRRGMPLPESGKPPRRRPGWPTDTKDDFAGSTR